MQSLLKVKGFLKIFKTPVVKVTAKNQVWPFYTQKNYEEALQNPPWPANAKHKYYKGLGTSTPTEAKNYFRNLSTHL